MNFNCSSNSTSNNSNSYNNGNNVHLRPSSSTSSPSYSELKEYQEMDVNVDIDVDCDDVKSSQKRRRLLDEVPSSTSTSSSSSASSSNFPSNPHVSLSLSLSSSSSTPRTPTASIKVTMMHNNTHKQSSNSVFVKREAESSYTSNSLSYVSPRASFLSTLPTFSKHSSGFFGKGSIYEDENDLNKQDEGEIDETESTLSDVSDKTLTVSTMSEDATLEVVEESVDSYGDKKNVVKRRIYHRRANPFPRVLKRDIRRDYGAMLVNVMNSFDGDLTSKFFNQFCVKNCHKLDLFPEVTRHYNLPGYRHVDGLNQIVYNLLHDLSHIPDSVCRIKDSHIRQRSDIQGSQVCVRVLFQGTKIYTNQTCNVQNLLSSMQAALSSSNGSFPALNGSSASPAVSSPSDMDDEDNQSVSSNVSALSSSSVLPSGRSLWLPVPPELDEKELNSLDVQTLHRHLKSFALRQHELSSVKDMMSLSGLDSSSNSVCSSPGSPRSILSDDDMSAENLDIINEKWYENRGMTLLPKPFKITVDGTIIMHLDEENRIHRLEFVSSSLLADMNMSNDSVVGDDKMSRAAAKEPLPSSTTSKVPNNKRKLGGEPKNKK